MVKIHLLRLVYHLRCDPCGQILLEDVLKTEEHDLIVFATAALEVGLQVGQAGRILLVVGGLL